MRPNGSIPVTNYAREERFAAERATILQRLPHVAAHSSELVEPGAFRVIEFEGLPVLLTRDKDGTARAFLNVCRHRGARLVSEDEGCKHHFTCPYHAWTYGSDGALVGGPHMESGFPDIDKAQSGLAPLPTHESMGLIWVVPKTGMAFDIEAYLEPMHADFAALDLASHVIVAQDTIEIAANWKILVEGGIEAYHFKIAHRDTIAPFFEDNLSSYTVFAPHMRSILPRATMAKLDRATRDAWRVRDHANVLYTFFPTTQFLVQQDHVVMITSRPLAADRTALRIATLAPKANADDAEHWQRNHAITRTTLDEDFALGEGIQTGLASGANSHLTLGRFEGALTKFNAMVDAYLQEDQGHAS